MKAESVSVSDYYASLRHLHTVMQLDLLSMQCSTSIRMPDKACCQGIPTGQQINLLLSSLLSFCFVSFTN